MSGLTQRHNSIYLTVNVKFILTDLINYPHGELYEGSEGLIRVFNLATGFRSTLVTVQKAQATRAFRACSRCSAAARVSSFLQKANRT